MAHGGKGLTIRSETHAIDPMAVNQRRGKLLTVAIPQFDCAVLTRRSNDLTVWAEMREVDWLVVRFEEFEFREFEIPKFDGIVLIHRGNRVAVSAEGHSQDGLVMLESRDFSPVPAPKLDRLVATGSRNHSTIWAETDVVNCIQMPNQGLPVFSVMVP